MHILRSAQHRRMPWKNGGGETLEVAIFPLGASVDDFSWRVSMARVDASGPFSLFSGTDRILAVLEGAMNLSVAGRPPVRLSPTSAAHEFPGDAPAHAEVLSTVTDLNVMIRRSEFSAQVRKLQQAKVVTGSDETFVLVRSDAQLATGETLQRDDVVRLGPSESIVFDGGLPDAWLIQIKAQ
jgi:uncharacterized protein